MFFGIVRDTALIAVKAMPHGSEKSPAKNRNEICDKSWRIIKEIKT